VAESGWCRQQWLVWCRQQWLAAKAGGWGVQLRLSQGAGPCYNSPAAAGWLCAVLFHLGAGMLGSTAAGVILWVGYVRVSSSIGKQVLVVTQLVVGSLHCPPQIGGTADRQRVHVPCVHKLANFICL
jgi:hypothetical protein